MAQGYKIFKGEFCMLIIASKVEKISFNFQSFELKKIKQVNKILNAFISDKNKQNYQLVYDNPKEIMTQIKKKLDYIKAAGGIVKNKNDDLLLIKKNGIWDLPKGKVEKNESSKQAAIREVKEECGINKLELTSKAGKTYHIGSIKRKKFIKKTKWYNMKSLEDFIPKPAIEEGITEIKWTSVNSLQDFFPNMHSNLIDLLQQEFSLYST